MAGIRAASRYAKGLTQYAQEVGQTQALYAEMLDLKTTLANSHDLRTFLQSPIFDEKKKQSVLAEVFKSFSPLMQKFIALTVNQGRENILDQIADQFIRLYDAAHKIVTAEVTSAVELDQATLDKIVAKAKESLPADAQVKVENKVDSSLIGGFVLRVGNQQIDTSIKTKVANLKKEFSKNDYIPKY